VPKDLQKAAKWYQDGGQHNYSLPRYSYADMLYSGQGVDEDRKEAAKWYEKAAEAEKGRGAENPEVSFSDYFSHKQEVHHFKEDLAKITDLQVVDQSSGACQI
jgi:TPR repeat protein